MPCLKLFTFCFYIGKNTYHELVRMLYLLVMSLDRFHPDFFLVVYHNLGITVDDPRVRMVNGFGGGGGWEVKGGGGGGGGGGGEGGGEGDERLLLLLDAEGCDGNVWVEGSAVRNRWHKLSFNKIRVFKLLYDEYEGECFTWIDLDTIVVADLSYLCLVDNYFVMHGGRGERSHDVLLGAGGSGSVLWAIPERMYIQGSFWKLNLSLYHEVLRLDALFRENGVGLKYDLQSIFAVMAWGGESAPFYDGPSWAMTNSMLVFGYNYRPDVMNGLGVWDTKNSVGNHVNLDSLAEMKWTDAENGKAAIFRTNVYPDKEIHILSLTFDSFFASNISSSEHFSRLLNYEL